MPVTRVLYPLHQLGNPQLRIFRPKWFLTLVRPGKEQPPDTVQFHIPMEMTKLDVKNYLEKIYEVPVGAVRTRIQFGSNKKRNHLNQRVNQPDYKLAYVHMLRGSGRCFDASGIPAGVGSDTPVSSDAQRCQKESCQDSPLWCWCCSDSDALQRLHQPQCSALHSSVPTQPNDHRAKQDMGLDQQLQNKWAKPLPSLTSSQQRSRRSLRDQWRTCRRSSWRTRSRGKSLTPGGEGSPNGLGFETTPREKLCYTCECLIRSNMFRPTTTSVTSP
ncbi:unnamed protein product [Tetraodon nigroviridis]|uniref:Large ribosomal subunit protein uL23m n=2 Tax=Tetraodon nigroviridis TaxID=99883 RepID=Q4SDZ2_TETNG|nr:unnamed protein product [Tetraodon nigroviridis]